MLFQYERDSEYSCDLIDLFRLEMCLSVPNPIATNPIHHLKSAKCARPPLPSPAAAAATLPLDSNPAYPPPASPSTRAFFLRASPTPAKNPVHSTYVVEIAQQGRDDARGIMPMCVTIYLKRSPQPGRSRSRGRGRSLREARAVPHPERPLLPPLRSPSNFPKR